MTELRHIAVIDVGKTNAKLALVEAETLAELAVVTRPNLALPGPPWPHFDLEGHWSFFLKHLADFHASHGVNAIAVTTHGASCVLLGHDGGLAAPMLDYEFSGPDALAADYDAIRPGFNQTGSPRLPAGLNLGAQLHWQFETFPDLRARVAQIVTYPQYWGFCLTGRLACDVTSLGCHTDLWDPWTGTLSPLAARLGIAGLLAPAWRPDALLGTLLPDVAAVTGLSLSTPVVCGIHDSNASLYPYLRQRNAPFAVVSTGTWVVAMAVDGVPVAPAPDRDALVNVNAFGQPILSARFMGGREFDIAGGGGPGVPSDADRREVLARGILLLPSIETGSGPFPGRIARWTAEPTAPGQRKVALGHYLALMTDTCLSLTDAAGPVIVEGPIARNGDFLAMLAAVRPDGVEVAVSATGTSAGAALLCAKSAPPPRTQPAAAPDSAPALRLLADRWRAETR